MRLRELHGRPGGHCCRHFSQRWWLQTRRAFRVRRDSDRAMMAADSEVSQHGAAAQGDVDRTKPTANSRISVTDTSQ